METSGITFEVNYRQRIPFIEDVSDDGSSKSDLHVHVLALIDPRRRPGTASAIIEFSASPLVTHHLGNVYNTPGSLLGAPFFIF